MKTVALSALLLLIAGNIGAQSHCYSYGADSVELIGVLARRVYPGPPNYESIKAGDYPDTVWVLRLNQSICTNASGVSKARQRVREVQLFVPEADQLRMRTMQDKPTMFRGKLRPAELGWHHLPIVFWAQLVLVDMRRSD
jgi:hypothetical protein